MLSWVSTDVSAIIKKPNEWTQSYFFRVFPGWNTYTIDLTQIGIQTGNLRWGGSITGLMLFPGFSTTGARIQNVIIDWVRLTPKPSRTLAWSGSWPVSSSATILCSTDGATYDPLRVYTNNRVPNNYIIVPNVISAGDNGKNGSYQVPASFPPGSVRPQVKINGVTSETPAGPWQINAMPTIKIVAPSYTSGQDFATSVVGNPWDMDSAADIASWKNLTGAPQFSNGLLTATSSHISTNCGMPWGDPELMLNMGGKSVDTNRYRYLTMKVKVNAPLDFSNGWVSRFVWVQNTYDTYGCSNDLPLYAGWNTFQVDLWGNVQDDQQPGTAPWRTVSPNLLRVDPHEIPPATQFEVDYIKLTAADEANAAFNIRWELTDPDSNDVTLEIYAVPEQAIAEQTGKKIPIATVKAGNRTAALAPSATVPDQPAGEYKVYLPLVLNSYYPPCDWEGNCVTWYTSDVPAGTYYIEIDAYDGYNRTEWTSDTPVVIKHQ
jgi:hypothetical protein